MILIDPVVAITSSGKKKKIVSFSVNQSDFFVSKTTTKDRILESGLTRRRRIPIRARQPFQAINMPALLETNLPVSLDFFFSLRLFSHKRAKQTAPNNNIAEP